MREITYHSAVFGVSDKSTNWKFDDSIMSSCSVTLLGSSFFSIICFDDFLMTEFSESRFVRSSNEYDISTISPITSIGSTFWDIFFTTPRDNTITSFTRFECHFYFIDEHRFIEIIM